MPIENQSVRDYLMQKKAERDALEKENQGYDTMGAISGGLASLGAAFQGKDSIGAASQAMKQREDMKRNKLVSLDAGVDRYTKDLDTVSVADKRDRETKVLAENDDPTSQATLTKQQLATKMQPNIDWSKMSGSQIDQHLPTIKDLFKLDQANLDRREARDERRFQSGIKMDEKMEGLKTPFGVAHTVEDAKGLKSAHEAKSNFDSKLQDMIDLRKKHGGGAIMNREDVARGKQLSNDLLLAYKDMAKLGVLSAKDTQILNSIIPEDPLEYNSPLAAISGQDPVLHKMEAFKGDSDKDFETRIATRVREGQRQGISKDDDPAVIARRKRIAELKAKQQGSFAKK